MNGEEHVMESVLSVNNTYPSTDATVAWSNDIKIECDHTAGIDRSPNAESTPQKLNGLSPPYTDQPLLSSVCECQPPAVTDTHDAAPPDTGELSSVVNDNLVSSEQGNEPLRSELIDVILRSPPSMVEQEELLSHDKIESLSRGIPPSLLAANEEMLSEDEDDDDDQMEEEVQSEPIINSSKDSAIVHESSGSSHHSSPILYPGSDSELTTSGIVSSFNADSFLYDPSSRDCSESVSPDKPPGLILNQHNMSPVPSGVASFSSIPFDVPENLTSAPMEMSMHNFPNCRRHANRTAFYAMHPFQRATCRSGAGVNVTKTLDLLKAVMQSSFNQEVKKLCDDYFQIYGMAAINIHENTGDHVSPATLRLLVCKMLEEAMQGYQNNKWEFSSLQLPKNDRLSEYKGSPMSTKKPRTEKEHKQGTTGKRGRKPTEKVVDNRSAWKWSLDKRRLDPVKWSIDKLNTETKFVLGVNVNKALGHAANRGKVYILHPQLFKYVCDGDDKTWLFDNKFMPVHGGKAFLMIYDEVELLTKSDDTYKESNEIFKSVQNLNRFSVPPFMLEKMKDFVKHVQGFFAQESASQSAGVISAKE